MSFRYALRVLLKHPGSSILAVSSLAAGIGLTVALASIADAILFRPLPVSRPSEIVRIYTASAGQPLGFVSYPDYEDLHKASQTVAGIVAQSQVLLAVGGEGSGPAQVRMGLAVTPNYFDMLGVPAALGRTFSASEERQPVVVLSYRFADGKTVGATLRIGGTRFTVIGVAPEDFGLDPFKHEDFYVPMGVYGAGLLPATGRPLEDRARRYLTLYGRLRPGVRLHAAQAELGALAAKLETEYPDTNRGRRALALTELSSRMQSNSMMPSLAAILLAVAALVMVIACANAAGLLLLRGEARAHEIAVRLAMGLSQGRLLAQLCTESLMLAAAGAAGGMLLAWAAVRTLIGSAALPTDMPLSIAPRMDWRAGALAIGATTLAAIACAAAPWIAARGVETSRVLRRRNGSGGSSARNVLVTIEIALAMAMVASGGLLLENLAAAGRIDLGYRLDHVLAMAFDPAQVRYSEARTRAFYRELLERARGLPEVRAAVLAQSAPLAFTGAQRQIAITGATEQNRLTVWMNAVTPGYFELMHMPILEGRGFDERDTETSPPVVVINEELARFWKNGEAVGGRIRIGGAVFAGVGAAGLAAGVIGIVRTAKYFQVGEAPRPFFYLPYSQSFASRMVLHVETWGAPAAAAPAVLAEVRELDPAQPVSEVRTLEDYFSQGGLFGIRMGLRAVGIVGACGLLLALAGLYSVVSSEVARRRREIGVRVAVGASRPIVVGLVLGDGMRLAAVGTLGGLGLALVMRRLLAGLLVGTAAGADWQVLAVSALMAVAATLAACLVPAWRASGIDPAVALREE
jgi:putative ABC transport system permease protein